MIMIEKCRSFLSIRIVARCGLPRDKPVFRVAITFRTRSAAMKVYHRSYFRFVGFRPVKCVVDREDVLMRQLIRPFHQQRVSAACTNGWAWTRRVISPKRGWWHITMHGHLKLPNGHSVVRDL